MATISPPVAIPATLRSPKPAQATVLFWFSLSLTIAAAIGMLQMQKAFGSAYVVQDDARQHIFWMQRFLDPELFPNDLIADYFQSVAPWGFTTLYQIAASVGLDPAWFNKILPIFIWLITTAYCFGVSMQIFPVPMAGFLSATLLNLSTFQADDILSATPRAFAYPLFVAFLYYLMKRSPLPCAIAIALQGVFYPQVMLVSAGLLILRLIQWRQPWRPIWRWRLRLRGDRRDYLLVGVGLGITGLIIGMYLFQGTGFEPVISVPEAKQMPEFWEGGRAVFFTHNPIDYWLLGNRSGMLPRLSRLLKPFVIVFGLFLPRLLQSPGRFPLGRLVTPQISILVDTLLASGLLFLAAHAILFKLHHPSRYTQHTIRIVMALTAGITLVILLNALFRRANQNRTWRSRLAAWGATGGLALYLGLFPIAMPLAQDVALLELIFPKRVLPAYVYGTQAPIYEFFAQQPKDTLVVSLSKEVSNIPSFARRSILTGWEYGIPYHKGYYDQFQARSQDLYQAHYSPDLAVVRQFTDQYGVDFWMVAEDAFTPKAMQKPWGSQLQPEMKAALLAQEQGQVPVVKQAMEQCAVLHSDRFVILQADCVVIER